MSFFASANIALSRMVFRSNLSAAIADVGKAERAAEACSVASSDLRESSKLDSFLKHSDAKVMQQERVDA
jgi:hypothetical protein